MALFTPIDLEEELAVAKAKQWQLKEIINLRGAMSISNQDELVKYAGKIATLEYQIAKVKKDA